MKASLILPVYNRPQYLSQCLASLKQADWPKDILVIMINDASTDAEAVRLFNEFAVPGVDIIKYTNPVNKGIKYNIQFGVEKAWQFGKEYFIVLDSDAVVKPEFFKVIENWHSVKGIFTGFNSRNKNIDGTDRHKIIKEDKSCIIQKESVGGINFCFDKDMYERWVYPALKGPGNWDHQACKNSMADGVPILCVKPSIVQHIGLSSAMNHNEEPDVACDFFNMALPNVTLFGADTSRYDMLKKAAEVSQRDIQFADVKILTNPDVDFGSKDDYSRFMIKRLTEFVSTDFVLNIQWDGYVLNWKAWRDEFLQYDFVGATWNYHDGMNVGNGGFSLRSKKLLNILATDDAITETTPEDHQICRRYRPYLEEKYGIKFAPAEVADKFSIEAHGHAAFPGSNKYSGQFGFHGWNIDYAGSGLNHIPQPPVVVHPARYPRQFNATYRGNQIGRQ